MNVTSYYIKISPIKRYSIREHQLCDEIERLQIAIDSLKSGTWTYDSSTNSLMVCSKCKEFIPAMSSNCITSSELIDLVAMEYSRQVSENFLLALKASASFDIEVPIVVPNEFFPRWFRITGANAFGRSKALMKIHGSIEDISDRKRSELLKRDHLAIVSHDLRSPLSVIKLYMQLCEREAGNHNNYLAQEMLKKSRLQVDKMIKLIDCYLDGPENGTGASGYTPSKFNITELFEEAISDMHLLHPDYIFSLKAVAGVIVFADRSKIGQVVQNLLSNAVKYSSPTDVITISFCRTKNELRVQIQDHGIGIKPTDQKKIFDRFYRAADRNGPLVKGYGIGLYLTKQILIQHHGDIWLKSEIGKGSKFYFSLPLPGP